MVAAAHDLRPERFARVRAGGRQYRAVGAVGRVAAGVSSGRPAEVARVDRRIQPLVGPRIAAIAVDPQFTLRQGRVQAAATGAEGKGHGARDRRVEARQQLAEAGLAEARQRRLAGPEQAERQRRRQPGEPSARPPVRQTRPLVKGNGDCAVCVTVGRNAAGQALESLWPGNREAWWDRQTPVIR